jgi:hypothetical protein
VNHHVARVARSDDEALGNTDAAAFLWCQLEHVSRVLSVTDDLQIAPGGNRHVEPVGVAHGDVHLVVTGRGAVAVDDDVVSDAGLQHQVFKLGAIGEEAESWPQLNEFFHLLRRHNK